MRLTILIILLISTLTGVSQIEYKEKRLIDTSLLGNWPLAIDMKISPNGDYVAYRVINQPIGDISLLLQATNEDWQIRLATQASGSFVFSKDNKSIFYLSMDTLYAYSFIDKRKRTIDYATELEIPFNHENRIIYKNTTNSLVCLNTSNYNKHTFSDVILHMIEGGLLIVEQKSTIRHQLQSLNLETGLDNTIWKDTSNIEIKQIILDETQSYLSLLTQDKKNSRTLWTLSLPNGQIKNATTENQLNFQSKYSISHLRLLTKDCRWLFIDVKKELFDSVKAEKLVDVWSFKDSILLPAQKLRLDQSYLFAFNLETNTISAIENDTISVYSKPLINDQIMISVGGLYRGPDIKLGSWWPHSSKRSLWILSLKSGNRKLINENGHNIKDIQFSKDGRFIIYWDNIKSNYYSFNVELAKTICLTCALPEICYKDYMEVEYTEPIGIAAYDLSGTSLYLYGKYNIFKVSLIEENVFQNVTAPREISNKIKFRFIYEADFSHRLLTGKERLVLTGFNDDNFFNGLYEIKLNSLNRPISLIEGPYTFYVSESQISGHDFTWAAKPIVWDSNSLNRGFVFLRHSYDEYPNYWFTRDFKRFKQLTSFQPHKQYKWLTAEAVSWNMENGKIVKGVLYKPENFDSSKKYPIIFNFYEKSAHRLFQFPRPGLTYENINIPWFVSRGYLVFTPDIHYEIASKTGKTVGESALEHVEAAARLLSKRSYVDSSKMGLQGHSFGGFESSYIATHSKLFAAAAEMAGTTDMYTSYFSLIPGVMSNSIEKVDKQDHSQGRMGATPWEKPELYFRNSALTGANNAVCPILITHNKKDDSNNFRQGVSFYLALRRLGKPCWLLQYDNSDHVLNEKDALDYTIRLTQYFDHYLKRSYPPKWLTQALPSQLKGTSLGYELDFENNCHTNCRVCASMRK